MTTYLIKIFRNYSPFKSYELSLDQGSEKALVESIEETLNFIKRMNENVFEFCGGGKDGNFESSEDEN